MTRKSVPVMLIVVLVAPIAAWTIVGFRYYAIEQRAQFLEKQRRESLVVELRYYYDESLDRLMPLWIEERPMSREEGEKTHIPYPKRK